MYECNIESMMYRTNSDLRKEDVELGLDAKEAHDVQKEAEDVDECLEETLCSSGHT